MRSSEAGRRGREAVDGESTVGRLASVNVGLARDIDWRGRVVRTAIWKRPVLGRVMAHRLNLDGDQQGDRVAHGGEVRAVMVYQSESYRYWETQLGRQPFELGQFGENFTVDGLADDEVCIGDRYSIGGAVFEVSQPRVTCYRVGIRMANPMMPALLVSHKRTGFYLRVIEEGDVGAGDPIVKVADGPERMTVAAINSLVYLPGRSHDQLQRGLRIAALPTGWKGSLEVLAVAEHGDDSHQDEAGKLNSPCALPPLWRGFRALRVAAIRDETTDVRSFVLKPEHGTVLPPHEPGQYVTLKLALIDSSPPIIRNYSISGGQDGAYRISVKRANGAGSHYLHDRVQLGDLLHVSAPRGDFRLEPSELPVVLLSAGIGVTPMLSMLHSLAASDTRSARALWWCHGARNGKNHVFAAEARALVNRLTHGRSFVAYSDPNEADLLGQDYDARGRLDLAAVQALGVPQEADFYVCGPAAFLTDFTASLVYWGIAPSRIHSETFGESTSGILSGPQRGPHLPAGDAGNGPSVCFKRSELTVPWDARFKSLLEIAEACEVPVTWSCRAGVCHMCESSLLRGSASYMPVPLDLPAEGKLLICCAAPSSDVILDM